jgi:sugar phosphate isomerase/epimerase
MQLGYLTTLTRDEIANAKRLGYDALEVRPGWGEKATFAQIRAELPALKDALAEHGIGITSVAIYGGTIETDYDLALSTYRQAIELTRALGCNVVSGMTGRDNTLTVDENLPVFKRYFEPIASMAADQGVRIALENWPGGILGHGPYRWTNLATTPELWAKLFETVPNPALGLEYDPSHLVWQQIDHLRAIRDFSDRIHHIHAKDIVIDEEKLGSMGVHGRGWWRFVIPGLGQIDWQALFDTLAEVGYAGDMAVEHEDNAYTGDRRDEGLAIGVKSLRPLVDEYNG